jgi:NADH dehydrogenase [ubiquinone] 1 alpha subcomplex assembly factor 5
MQSSPPILFDRAQLRKLRARRVADFARADFLHREAVESVAESLHFIARAFPTVVELGAHSGLLGEAVSLRAGTQHYIACDLAEAALSRLEGARICADEELLPFAENSVDAVLSILSLQWVNDLPGTLAQIHRMLKPDGLFIAVVPGGETLSELRATFAMVESVRTGGIHPRVAPFIDVRDAGALLQRAGFALPVADSDTLTITYPHLFGLMDDLRSAAQTNMLQQQVQHFTPRGFFADATAHYAEHYKNAEGELTATVELITLTGWKPAANQQQPAKRGSGKISLVKALQ